jgi:hypothetical protein
MFGEVLKDDELNEELDALIAAEVEKELADLGPAPLFVQPQQEVEQEDDKVAV